MWRKLKDRTGNPDTTKSTSTESDPDGDSLSDSAPPTSGYVNWERRIGSYTGQLTETKLSEIGNQINSEASEYPPDPITKLWGNRFAWDTAAYTAKAVVPLAVVVPIIAVSLLVYSMAASVDSRLFTPIEVLMLTVISGGSLVFTVPAFYLVQVWGANPSEDTRGETGAAIGQLFTTTHAGTEVKQVFADVETAAADDKDDALARRPGEKSQAKALDTAVDHSPSPWQDGGTTITQHLSQGATPLADGTSVKIAEFTVGQTASAGRLERGRGASTEAAIGVTKADEILNVLSEYTEDQPLTVFVKTAQYRYGTPNVGVLAKMREKRSLKYPLNWGGIVAGTQRLFPGDEDRPQLEQIQLNSQAAQRLQATNRLSLSEVRIIVASTNVGSETDQVITGLRSVINSWTGSANIIPEANVETVTVGQDDEPLKRTLDTTVFYREPITRSLWKRSPTTSSRRLTLPRNVDSRLPIRDQYRTLVMDNTELGSLFVVSDDGQAAKELVDPEDPDDSLRPGGSTINDTRLDDPE